MSVSVCKSCLKICFIFAVLLGDTSSAETAQFTYNYFYYFFNFSLGGTNILSIATDWFLKLLQKSQFLQQAKSPDTRRVRLYSQSDSIHGAGCAAAEVERSAG